MRLSRSSPGPSPSRSAAAVAAALVLGGCFGPDVLVRFERDDPAIAVTTVGCRGAGPCTNTLDAKDPFVEDAEAKSVQVGFDVAPGADNRLSFWVHTKVNENLDSKMFQEHTFGLDYAGPGAQVVVKIVKVEVAGRDAAELRYTLPGKPEAVASSKDVTLP